MPFRKKSAAPKKVSVPEKESAPVAAAPTEEEGGNSKNPELLRGFRDIMPEEQGRWNLVRDTVRKLAEAYSFDRIDLPILERADLFLRTLGKGTDVVEKEMYIFTDPSNRSVALRPEATASAARAYINHGMLDRPQPVKLWYLGPMFRHDRPQAGRYRQFYQAGFESFGAEEPIVDAQLVVIGMQIFKDLGLDVKVEINSIGTAECRKAYLAELVAYFRTHRAKLSEDDKRRLQKNPLRILDSKEEATRELLEGAPQILNWLDEKSKEHFMKVLEFVEEMDIPYSLNPYLVRGLDYYTHTVFEFVLAEDQGEVAQSALGGGGRYDGLVEVLGGRPTPACGFALGLERIVRALEAKGINPPEHPAPLVFFAQLGDAARRVGLKLYEEFRRSGIPVAEAFGKNALKAQLEAANRLNVPLTLILGQKEVLDGTIIIRDMESGAQEIVDVKKAVALVARKLQPVVLDKPADL
ncbi:histidine--tRNA ligase [Candidatus Uhrbacteria bacterium]|nr:histidine--tRNA ligase [Candidatus Uhrbacteria bacterium]